METRQARPAVGMTVLFFTEMWERFSYYGMRALLIFYMTETFLFGDTKSYAIYGSYTALVYLTPVFGGLLADRVLGYRKAVTLGAVLMALGHFTMAVENVSVFYLALALLIVGNGFFKPNISTIVGRLYPEGGAARDSAFTIFYMGVNLGAMAAPIACGFVGETFGWHWGFSLAGFGMVAGLFVFRLGQGALGGAGERVDPAEPTRPIVPSANREMLVYLGAAVAVAGAWKLIELTTLVGYLLPAVGLPVLIYLAVYSFLRCAGAARHRLWVAMALTLVSVVFWAFFEQAGSSLNLFTERNVDRVVWGTEIAAPVFQSVNPAFILLLGMGFAALWVGLARVDRDPSIPMKFALGIFLLGLGFAALYYGAVRAQNDGMVALGWLILGYLLHTTGELCLSPVGLSMITKLAPREITGMMMGTWFLSISYAQYVAGMIAQLTGIETEAGEAVTEIDPVQTVMIYGGVFGTIAVTAIVVGLAMAVVAPLLNRGTHGIR